MSPRPDRRPDSRPDRAPRRPAGAAGSRAGGRPAGSSFRPGGTSRPRWGRPEGSRSEAPGDRPRYGRDGGSRFSADRSSPDRFAGERSSPNRERPSGEWTPRPSRGGESSGPPARFERSGPRPSQPRRPEEGRFEARPTDRRPADRRPSDRRETDRRPTDRRPLDRRPGESRFSDRSPSDRAPMDRRPTDRRPSDRRPAEAGPSDRDRRPRPGVGRPPSGRPVLFRSAGRGDARPDFGAPPRRFERDQPRVDPGVASESDTFANAAPNDLIWGRHSAQATLESGRPIHRIWCTPEMRFSPKFLQLLRDAKASGVLVEEVTWARLGQISGGAVHQGIVLQPAAAETLDLATLIDGCRELGESPLLLAVDGLTDPQNLGAIVRSAEALGAHGMVLPQRRNAGLTGSVAKVAAGALEHLPVARVVNLNRSLETLKEEGYRVIGLAGDGNVSLEEVDLDGPLVIVTGSEGDGLAMLTRRNCDQLVRIPLRGATPSLNAAVATALLLYEIARRGWMRGLRGSSPAPRLLRPSLPAPAMPESPAAIDELVTAEPVAAELVSAEQASDSEADGLADRAFPSVDGAQDPGPGSEATHTECSAAPGSDAETATADAPAADQPELLVDAAAPQVATPQAAAPLEALPLEAPPLEVMPQAMVSDAELLLEHPMGAGSQPTSAVGFTAPPLAPVAAELAVAQVSPADGFMEEQEPSFQADIEL